MHDKREWDNKDVYILSFYEFRTEFTLMNIGTLEKLYYYVFGGGVSGLDQEQLSRSNEKK